VRSQHACRPRARPVQVMLGQHMLYSTAGAHAPMQRGSRRAVGLLLESHVQGPQASRLHMRAPLPESHVQGPEAERRSTVLHAGTVRLARWMKSVSNSGRADVVLLHLQLAHHFLVAHGKIQKKEQCHHCTGNPWQPGPLRRARRKLRICCAHSQERIGEHRLEACENRAPPPILQPMLTRKSPPKCSTAEEFVSPRAIAHPRQCSARPR